MNKVKSKKDVILEAQEAKKNVHFAALMDICHFKNCQIKTKAPKIQRTNRAPRRQWKDDSDAHAVFTEQGSSASQMTLQKPWVLLRDYQDVLDKPLTQYQLTPR